MPKILRGRIAGLNGMDTWTAEQLYALADEFKERASAVEPGSRAIDEPEHPQWLLRWAERLHCLAVQKDRASEHKAHARRTA